MQYNGRSARLSKTPHYPALFQQDESEMLSDEKASQFRSSVGLALYISHDRWDISFAVKSIAAYLKTLTILACFMYLFKCVLQWISFYDLHFGSRGYSFVITCNFLSTLHAFTLTLHMRFHGQFL